MHSLVSSDTEETPSLIAHLRAGGFTEGQAIAIEAAIQSTIADDIQGLRDDLLRWHLYIALYLLAQVAIALLAALMMHATLARPLHVGTITVDDVTTLLARHNVEVPRVPGEPWQLLRDEWLGVADVSPSRVQQSLMISISSGTQARVYRSRHSIFTKTQPAALDSRFRTRLQRDSIILTGVQPLESATIRPSGLRPTLSRALTL